MELLILKILFSVVVWGLIIGIANGGPKWVRVNIPQYRIPGESALLQCDYNLGNDTLYAVKWYKDHEEFYRFVPKARPQASSYQVEGIRVDMSKSDNKKVVLYSVDWKTSGLYRCEVSAEAPSFSSAQSEARLEVVFFSHEDPVITGMIAEYQIGDEITLNCTSGKSYPASILHWFINEQQIANQEALIHYPPSYHHHGLISTTLGIRFILSNRHFLGGMLKIKCIASMTALRRTGNESIIQNLPIQDLREALIQVKSESSSVPPPYFLLPVIVFSSLISTST